MDLITLNDVYKTYHVGEIDVPVLKGVSLRVGRGELVAADGRLGIGQEHADEHPGLPRSPDIRRILAR